MVLTRFGAALLVALPALSGCDQLEQLTKLQKQQEQMQKRIDGLSKALDEAKVVEPEQCALDAMKNASAGDAGFIRWTCVRKYVKANLGSADTVPTNLVNDSRLNWAPAPAFLAAMPAPEFREAAFHEHAIVTLKNQSALRIIAADVVIFDNQTSKSYIFRGYADAPIDPWTVGTITVLTNLSLPSGTDFAQAHSWSFGKIFGVPINAPY